MSKCYYCGGRGCPECKAPKSEPVQTSEVRCACKAYALASRHGGVRDETKAVVHTLGVCYGSGGYGGGRGVPSTGVAIGGVGGNGSTVAGAGYPQCVSVDNPDDIEGWGGVGRPAVGGMAPGLVLRRRDGSFRLVTDVDRERRLYVTRAFRLHSYALVPAGWVEVERIT